MTENWAITKSSILIFGCSGGGNKNIRSTARAWQEGMIEITENDSTNNETG